MMNVKKWNMTLAVPAFLALFISSVLYAGPNPDATKSSIETLGPFQLGNSEKTNVYADISYRHKKCFEKTKNAVKLTLRTKEGKVLREFSPEQYPGDCTSFFVQKHALPNGLSSLLVSEITLPSAPGTGGRLQYFRFNSSDQFVPITREIGTSERLYPIMKKENGENKMTIRFSHTVETDDGRYINKDIDIPVLPEGINPGE